MQPHSRWQVKDVTACRAHVERRAYVIDDVAIRPFVGSHQDGRPGPRLAFNLRPSPACTPRAGVPTGWSTGVTAHDRLGITSPWATESIILSSKLSDRHPRASCVNEITSRGPRARISTPGLPPVILT